jgi:DNA-binding NarL/FixJ family response regulator
MSMIQNDSSHKLLLVEDNQALNAVLSEFLSSAGHEVLSYESAEAIPKSAQFDIAILDLNLPGEDGLSLARRLKADNPLVGIILLTIRSALDDKLKGYEVGADVFLSKPIDPSELLAVLNSLSRRLTTDQGESGEKQSPTLTNKEVELLKCIADGMSYQDSAQTLGVSLSTVQTHIRSLYLKLGAHSKIEALKKAREMNLH